jgi:prepilin-type N-terminal cleavage/methylation domain-containing protein
MNKLNNGFSLIEVILVIVMLSALFGFVSVDYLKTRNRVSLDQTTQLLITDIKNQQLQMMAGKTNSLATNVPYGIYFEQNKYTLFHALSYASNDTHNFAINLDSDNQFTNINLPNFRIIFASTSGEIQNYNASQNTITISNINNNDQKIITINKYGVITSVQ